MLALHGAAALAFHLGGPATIHVQPCATNAISMDEASKAAARAAVEKKMAEAKAKNAAKKAAEAAAKAEAGTDAPVMAVETAVAPAAVAAVAATPKNIGDVNKMIGKYSVKPAVFDPLNLASRYDNNWLREAELKHGRVCMLAIVGFLANDAGLKFPGEVFQGVSSVDAHDKMVESGHMWGLLAAVGACELVHMSVIVPKLDGDWEDWQPGNYGLDPARIATDYTREAELKHSRLAMIGFGGLVTQAALGYPVVFFPTTTFG